MWRFAGVCMLACAGCTWDGSRSGITYACPDNQCPAGQVCRAGVCESGDAGIESAWCTMPPRFIEEFESELDPGRWAVTSTSGAVAHTVNGKLAIDYSVQGAEAEATMVVNVDHQDAEVTVEVASPPDISSGFIRMRMVDTPGTEPISLLADSFELSASIDSDFDVPELLRTAPFEPQTYRFWRIARTTDQICFYTSRDGVMFEQFACGSNLGIRSSLRVALSAGNYAGADPQTVGFDHLTWCVRAP